MLQVDGVGLPGRGPSRECTLLVDIAGLLAGPGLDIGPSRECTLLVDIAGLLAGLGRDRGLGRDFQGGTLLRIDEYPDLTDATSDISS
jgi:hypothetical protein